VFGSTLESIGNNASSNSPLSGVLLFVFHCFNWCALLSLLLVSFIMLQLVSLVFSI